MQRRRQFHFTTLWVCLAILVAPDLTFAQSSQSQVPALFAHGVKAFKDAKYDDARKAFLECLQIEPQNTDVLFNLGLTEAKAEKFGWALGYWREALRLNPWHSRSRKAIEWLAPKLRHTELPRRLSFWDFFESDFLNWLTISQLLFATSITLLVSGWLNLRYLGLRRRAAIADEPTPAIPVAAAMTSVTFLAALGVTLAKLNQLTTPRSTIVEEKVEARSARDPSSTTIFNLSEGHEVILRRVEDQWAQVTYPGGPTGWVPLNSLYQGRIP